MHKFSLLVTLVGDICVGCSSKESIYTIGYTARFAICGPGWLLFCLGIQPYCDMLCHLCIDIYCTCTCRCKGSLYLHKILVVVLLSNK